MTGMKKNMERVRGEVGKVFPAQGLESRYETLRDIGSQDCEKICLKFMATRNTIKGNGSEQTERGIKKAEKDQRGVNR